MPRKMCIRDRSLPLFPLSLGGFDFLHAPGAVGAVFGPVGTGGKQRPTYGLSLIHIEMCIRDRDRISRRSLRQVFGRCCYGCFVYDGQRSCTGSSRPAGISRNQAALGAIYQPAASLCVSLQRPAERKNVICQTRCQEPYGASGTYFVDFL